MSIEQVIAWKFNNQSGMRCQYDQERGTMQIVEFPGGIPSRAEQDQWTAEYQAWIAGGGMADKECDESVDLSNVNRVHFEMNFNQENRIRVLEGRPAVTRVQYRDALKAVWRTL